MITKAHVFVRSRGAWQQMQAWLGSTAYLKCIFIKNTATQNRDKIHKYRNKSKKYETKC